MRAENCQTPDLGLGQGEDFWITTTTSSMRTTTTTKQQQKITLT